MEEGRITLKFCNFKFDMASEYGDALSFGPNTAYSMDHCKVTTRGFFKRSFVVSVSSTKGSNITNSVFSTISQINIPIGLLYHNTREIVDNVFVRNITVKCAPSSVMSFVNSTATDPFGDQGHRKRITKTALLGFIDLMCWCSLCPKDEYSLQGDEFNVHVQNGSEVATYDKVKCIPCPYGADCSGANVKPKPNMWGQVENNAIAMYSCPGGYCCTGSDCRRYEQLCSEQKVSFVWEVWSWLLRSIVFPRIASQMMNVVLHHFFLCSLVLV